MANTISSYPERLCFECAQLDFDLLFRGGFKHRQWDIKIWNEKQCSFCRFLADVLGISGNTFYETVTLRSSVLIENGPVAYQLSCGSRHDNAILPLARPNHRAENNFGYGRIVETFANINLAKTWVSTCLEQHEGTCSKASIFTPLPFKLRAVDAKNMCICTLPENSTYLALSYVWGAVDQPKLSKGFFKPWSRKDGLLPVPLPQTIRDALSLTCQLGQRYLWVDSLCIMSDDPEDRKTQIEHMHIVYHQAMLTILAAAGDDANAGLPGLPKSAPASPGTPVRLLEM